MFQDSSNHAHLNHCCIQTATSSINKDQPREKTLSATVTSLDNNAGCEDSISCVDKNQSNTIMKRATKDLYNNSKVNARYRNDNTRIAAEDVLVPSSTCTRQNLKVADSRAQTLNPQYCIQTSTSSTNKDQPRKKTPSATVTSLDNNAGCNNLISCVDKNQSNTMMKRVSKDLSNISKINARDRNDNSRIAAEAVLAPSLTCTRQNLKVTDSRVDTLNPQCSYKPVAVSKSDAESGNPSRVNIFAVVFQILKVCFLTSLLFPHFI